MQRWLWGDSVVEDPRGRDGVREAPICVTALRAAAIVKPPLRSPFRNPHIIRHRVHTVDIAVAVFVQRGPVWPAFHHNVSLLRPEPNLVAVALEARGVMLCAPA